MRRYTLSTLCVIAAAALQAETYTVPAIGFAQNIGQYDADILFGRDGNYFRASSVQVSSDLSIGFVGALPTLKVMGEEALPHALHFYLGPDSARWRENVPHFSRVRYAGLYAGIDALWHGESLSFAVAPGADLGQILLRLHSAQPKQWSVYNGGDSIRAPEAYALYALSAGESVPRFYRALPVRFVQEDQNSFRVEVKDWDRSLPATITMNVPRLYDDRYRDAVKPGYDGSALISGSRGTINHGYLAKSAPGQPEFVSLIPARFLSYLVVGKDGSSTVAGVPADGSAVTPGESPQPSAGHGWVGRFDPRGRLTASESFGLPIAAMAVNSSGLVSLATPESILRWVPGQSMTRLDIPGVTSLAVNSSGLLAWCAPRTPNQTALPGAFKARYEGLHDAFTGTVEPSGHFRAATYVPVNGAPLQSDHSSRCTVAVSPSGSIWVSSEFSYWSGARAQTLVALDPSGSRVIHSESLPSPPVVSFDDRGNTLVAMSSNWPNLPTLPDAPLRAPCGQAAHLRTLSPTGAVLGATYLGAGGRFVEFSGPDRLFIENDQGDIRRIDPSPPAQPGIACLINPAHRRLQEFVAPGALTTIVGTGLGPLEAMVSAPDSRGQNPAQLAGVQVLANQTPVPVVSVQQGLVTFYLPEGFAGSQVQLQVRTPLGLIGGPSIRAASGPYEFGLFTVDGSGWGPAAVVNQDGSVNGPTNPARWGSVVSVFGTGPRPSGFDSRVEYFGPAPGLAQGVTQVNLRLDSRGTTSGWMPIIISGVLAPRALVYVTP